MSAEPVGANEWFLILSDWKRSDANVTVHLRGGVSLGPGKVTRLPSAALDSAEIRHDGDYARPETRWTFNLHEVVAITAEAHR